MGEIHITNEIVKSWRKLNNACKEQKISLEELIEYLENQEKNKKIMQVDEIYKKNVESYIDSLHINQHRDLLIEIICIIDCTFLQEGRNATLENLSKELVIQNFFETVTAARTAMKKAADELVKAYYGISYVPHGKIIQKALNDIAVKCRNE